eukprot:jgi/Mesen1/10372/ME000080S09759
MAAPAPKIAPSMLASDFACLADEAKRMMDAGADWLHLDIMAGADSFTFHLEAVPEVEVALELIRKVKAAGMKAAVGIKPNTPAEDVFPLVEAEVPVDMVLVMTVEPGFGGQKFMKDMMPKVDGGLGASTIDDASKAGANCIVAGSSVFGSKEPPQVIENLREKVLEAQASQKS